MVSGSGYHHEFKVGRPPVTGRSRTPEELRQWEVRAEGQPEGSSPLVTTRVVLDGGTTPVIWMYGAADGAVLGCLRPLVKGLDEPAEEFELYAADGTRSATLRREAGRLLPWPRRTRWVTKLVDGGKVVGGQGTWYSWAFYVGLFPVWAPLVLIVLIGALIQDGEGLDDFPGTPTRIRWFRKGRRGWVMSYGAGRTYRLRADGLDWHVAYGLGLASAWNELARYTQAR